MKKLLIITGIILFICIIITAASDSNKITAKNVYNVSQQTSSSKKESDGSDNEKYYIIKEYNKRVSVFENNAKFPIYMSEVYVNDLPEADLILLKKGIRVNDKKTLNRLLEDYCS